VTRTVTVVSLTRLLETVMLAVPGGLAGQSRHLSSSKIDGTEVAIAYWTGITILWTNFIYVCASDSRLSRSWSLLVEVANDH
jgi:hypothetical protein